jgi:hypothetical protein
MVSMDGQTKPTWNDVRAAGNRALGAGFVFGVLAGLALALLLARLH